MVRPGEQAGYTIVYRDTFPGINGIFKGYMRGGFRHGDMKMAWFNQRHVPSSAQRNKDYVDVEITEKV